MAQDYPATVKKWEVFEVALKGTTEGNPFVDQRLIGIFTNDEKSVTTEGFYDGDGIYRIRFMPEKEGRYSFILRGTFFDGALSGVFNVEPADPSVHGPVSVKDTFHFAYADGTPYQSVGTTAYVWHLQDKEIKKQTLQSLLQSGFNKVRFCVFPKHYIYNFKDPICFPYEGTPMDANVLTEDNFMEYMKNKEDNNFDFTRFNPTYFRNLEQMVNILGQCGIQADLILFHPYDRWGFSEMGREMDTLYLKYIINRLSSYHNVWWSLANEWDLLTTKTPEDWKYLGEYVEQNDLYHHLCSIHNCLKLYDHNQSWITHCSIQRIDLYKGAEETDTLRATYNKPVVNDEIAYEGDIPYGWGNITGEEMVRRFYETVLRGGYPGHGETYLNESDILWWAHGGSLHGESWKRVNFLKDVMDQVPGCQIAPMTSEWDDVCGVPECEKEQPVKSMYLYYYSFMRPGYRDYHIDDETEFAVDIIDTWDMTTTFAGVHSGKFRITLPAKQYILVRLRQPMEDELENFTEPDVYEVQESPVSEETYDAPSEEFVGITVNEEPEQVEESTEDDPFGITVTAEEPDIEQTEEHQIVSEDDDLELPEIVKEEPEIEKTLDESGHWTIMPIDSKAE